jgi:hypothetical protein
MNKENPSESDLNKFFFDSRLEKLASQLKKENAFNLFDVLQYSDYEIRHSNVIAWLLNPKSSHGLGSLFLEKFVRSLEIDEQIIGGLSQAADIVVEREKNNFDILLLSKEANTLILIENKVWSPEIQSQLKLYQNRIAEEDKAIYKTKILVLLSPYEEKPKEDQWTGLSYKNIYEILTFCLENKELNNNRIKDFIEQYRELLQKSVLKDKESDKIANAVSKDHWDILQFFRSQREDSSSYLDVFRNRGKEKFEALRYLISSISKYPEALTDYFNNELLEEFHMIRRGTKGLGYFVTKELQILLERIYPPYAKGKKTLYYNLLLYNHSVRNKIFSFDLWLYPGEPHPVRDQLVSLIEKSKHIFNVYIREYYYYRVHEYHILDENDFETLNLSKLKTKLKDGFKEFLTAEAPRIEKHLSDNLIG